MYKLPTEPRPVMLSGFGWGQPDTLTRAHFYFENGQSACGKTSYNYKLGEYLITPKKYCFECVRKLMKHIK